MRLTPRTILTRLQRGTLSVNQALAALGTGTVEHLGFAHIDNQRTLRRGFSETVFCQGKTIPQATILLDKIYQQHGLALGTRADPALFTAIRQEHPRAVYNEAGRVIRLGRLPRRQTGRIALITAGTSDIPVAEEAREILRARGQRVDTFYDIGVAGLHRIIDIIPQLRRCRVAVVIAGMDGALPSVVAGLLAQPVIAVPTSIGYGASFSGVAALLGMLNSCAEGVGVVNIDNGYGAACLAAMINDRSRK